MGVRKEAQKRKKYLVTCGALGIALIAQKKGIDYARMGIPAIQSHSSPIIYAPYALFCGSRSSISSI
jgi:hypothetical protein